MKKRVISVAMILLLLMSLCGCEASKTCPMCDRLFRGDGVKYGDSVICEDCDRDNQILNEWIGN